MCFSASEKILYLVRRTIKEKEARMWKHGFVWSILVVIAALLMVACAPKPVPPPTAAPATTVAAAPQVPVPTMASPTPAATTPVSKQATPTASPDDTVWAKIVDAAKKEGEVNVYSQAWAGDASLAIPKAFKDRYGITVKLIVGSSPSVFLERIKTEKRTGQIVADMVEGGDAHLLNEPGMLVSSGDILPALRERAVWLVDPMAYDSKKKTVSIYRLNQYSPFINTNLVKPVEAPSSWKDLLDPKWKGKIIMDDPVVQSGFYKAALPLLDRKIWDEGYVKTVYGQIYRIERTAEESFGTLARGESSLFLTTSDAAAGRFIMEGAPVRPIDMREGMVFIGASVVAINGGPNPNATSVLLNWLLEPEGQTVVGKARGNQMVRRDVPDFRPLGAQLKVTNPIFLTGEDADRATQLYKDRWFNKLVGR